MKAEILQRQNTAIVAFNWKKKEWPLVIVFDSSKSESAVNQNMESFGK